MLSIAMVGLSKEISVPHLFYFNIAYVYSNFSFSLQPKAYKFIKKSSLSSNMLILSGYKIFMQVV